MQALILFDDGSVDISPLSMVEAFQEETHDVEKTYKINWISKTKKVGVTCCGKILRYGTREELIPSLKKAEDGLSVSAILADTPESKLRTRKTKEIKDGDDDHPLQKDLTKKERKQQKIFMSKLILHELKEKQTQAEKEKKNYSSQLEQVILISTEMSATLKDIQQTLKKKKEIAISPISPRSPNRFTRKTILFYA